MSDAHLSDTQFSSFNFSPDIMQGIEDAGFSSCTPIQAETLPLALQGHDVAGQAQTGTGKTAAFLLAAFQHLLAHPAKQGRKPNQPRALMLAPTRELAIQIHKDARILGAHTGLSMVAVYGGMGYDTQRKELEQGVDLLIGTPGRTIDYFKQGVFDLKAVQVLVMDEADRMFDLGFIKDIRYLLRRLPAPDSRLNMLFSATLSHRVTELAYEHMNDPEMIKIEPEKVTVDRVRQAVYYTANDEKVPLLLGLLKGMDSHRTIVFINTKRAGERLWGYLEANGYPTALLTGDVPQKKRIRLLNDFQSGKVHIMVATDVAARGLHIENVSHVFNFDLPWDAEDYVHRIGRTARIGAAGDAISFACEDYAMHLMDVEEFIGHKIPLESITPELLVTPKPRKRYERARPPMGKKTGGRRPQARSGSGRSRRSR
ncbi:MAG: hypothetical protein BMS9Abin26_0339 [Gammaproteobacteria bacterium]|nr:MAG: hypothetical protein BMS9Abin26_0339 [Gammaproteobacteria bacterium]